VNSVCDCVQTHFLIFVAPVELGVESKHGISRNSLLVQEHQRSHWVMINNVRSGSLDNVNAQEECGTSAVY